MTGVPQEGPAPPPVVLDPEPERTDLGAGSWVDVSRGWLERPEPLLHHLLAHVPWEQGRRWAYDHHVLDPRLSRWYPASAPPPHPVLAEARAALVRRYRVPLGGVGLNQYRTGRDAIAFHRDRELRHLERTVIAILTLGATRPFLLRPRGGGEVLDLRPAAGDLLVMGGRFQLDWEHAVPRAPAAGPRVSCSWRWTSGEGGRTRAGWRAPKRYRSPDRPLSG